MMCSSCTRSENFCICTAAGYAFLRSSSCSFLPRYSDGRLAEEFVFSHCRRPTVYCLAVCQNKLAAVTGACQNVPCCRLPSTWNLSVSVFEMAPLSFWQPRDTSTRMEMFKSLIPVVARSALRFWIGVRISSAQCSRMPF